MPEFLTYRSLVAVLWQIAFAVLLAIPAHAAPTNIAAELIAKDAALPGQTVTLAIHMDPAAGWHGYWLNPGDAGLGMTLDWTLPKGAEAGQPQYPVPQTLLISGLMNHVYKGDYAVLVPLKLPDTVNEGSRLPVALDAQWLACTDEVCVPEQARLTTTINVGAPGQPDPRFDRWQAALPAPLNADAMFNLRPGTVRLGIPLPQSMALQNPHVFLGQDRVIGYAAPQGFSRTGDMLMIELQRPAAAAQSPERITGVIRLNDTGDGLSFSAASGPVPAAGTPIEPSPGMAGMESLPLLLIGALVGGLLLNIMPCVFPILSLKALSLARAGESESHARAEGLAYTAGVIAATAALGALMLALRTAGEQVGWAFQLQEPVVVAALLLLATAITANFLGLFEMTVPGFASEGSPQGAFATGLLAAFVATPCTGPFMAAAMGAALLLPVLAAMALFAALGLGIALPFLAIAFIPALRRRLPRPGPWMNSFRRWMAIPMGLTALALLWLASRVGGMQFALVSGLLALGLAALLILAGSRQRAGRPSRRPVLVGLAAIVLTGALVLPQAAQTPLSTKDSALKTIAFSRDALAKARASGKPTFAWFTADWCITCKVNEQTAIERAETIAAFEKAGVNVLLGDWTRRDPAITAYLTAQGAAGVPLYVWYPANGRPAEKLPQVLTKAMLIERAGR